VKGVWRTRVGYAGGDREDPTYHDLGDQSECVQVDFDPTVISYAQLVDLMLASHDPAGNPGYAQYASLVLTRGDEQLQLARERARLYSARLGKPLTTRIEPLKRFWPAEDYHQKYYLRADAALMEAIRGVYGTDEAAVRDSTLAMRLNGYASGSGARARLAGEIASFGLSADARAHLVSIVRETTGGGACALP
jgi:peptide-methionine (S)-S-oxide reductase